MLWQRSEHSQRLLLCRALLRTQMQHVINKLPELVILSEASLRAESKDLARPPRAWALDYARRTARDPSTTAAFAQDDRRGSLGSASSAFRIDSQTLRMTSCCMQLINERSHQEFDFACADPDQRYAAQYLVGLAFQRGVKCLRVDEPHNRTNNGDARSGRHDEPDFLSKIKT
jgi:hypothetical protein